MMLAGPTCTTLHPSCCGTEKMLLRIHALLLLLLLLLGRLLLLLVLDCDVLPAGYTDCTQWQINTTANFIQCPEMYCCTQEDKDNCIANNDPSFTCITWGPNEIACQPRVCGNGRCSDWVGGVSSLGRSFVAQLAQGHCVATHVAHIMPWL